MANLYDLARDCVLGADVDEKLDTTDALVSRWQAGELARREAEPPEPIPAPGRPQALTVVSPNGVKKRKFGSVKGRAALIHALAHIELTAVDLAWDTVYRYRDLPDQFYSTWIQAAGEEALHFRLLRKALHDLGFEYGDFPAHAELWKMSVTTGHELMDRMAIVHRVLEARALDVVPNTREKFLQLGDQHMVAALTRIANDEIGHVGAGTTWFRYRCQQCHLDPDSTFFSLIQRYLNRSLKGPFDHDLRRQAGFSEAELKRLDADAKNSKL